MVDVVRRYIHVHVYNGNCVWYFRWFPACCWPLVYCAVVCPSPPLPGSSLTGGRRDCGLTACPPRGTSCLTSAVPTSPGVSINRQYTGGGGQVPPPGSLSMYTCSPREPIFFEKFRHHYWVLFKSQRNSVHISVRSLSCIWKLVDGVNFKDKTNRLVYIAIKAIIDF